jgi:hypothetical protein
LDGNGRQIVYELIEVRAVFPIPVDLVHRAETFFLSKLFLTFSVRGVQFVWGGRAFGGQGGRKYERQAEGTEGCCFSDEVHGLTSRSDHASTGC